MPVRASDVFPTSDARTRLTDLTEHTVGTDANLVLTEDAVTGLQQALSGQFVTDKALDEALGVTRS